MKTLLILLLFPAWMIAQENGNYESLSTALADPEKVIHLELWSLEINELPKEIGRLKNVKSIVLRNNQLTTLPKQFRKLKNLEELSLGNNENLNPQQVCKVLSKLPKLRQLDLESTNLKSIPDELLFFPRLTELFLGHNSISTKEIEQFKQLRRDITVYE